jgi:RNA polymerase sigma-70 factor (ECF subfamily)
LIEYSPIAALNRTYALAKANGKAEAIKEAEKIGLTENHLYHALLGELYSGIDNIKAVSHLQKALKFAKSTADKRHISDKILACRQQRISADKSVAASNPMDHDLRFPVE